MATLIPLFILGDVVQSELNTAIQIHLQNCRYHTSAFNPLPLSDGL
jgi:hypothetical protein